jgi:nucleotidyltransferase substrate binding protein (TIGR01987 family)
MESDIRWKQRFKNFSRAINLLREVRELDIKSLSQLEKEGIIQRFEFTLELAWKTLKDKMEDDGLILDKISPKVVIKEAFQAKYVTNIDSWLKMIGDRNLMSHKYDFEVFEAIIQTIISEYTTTLEELYLTLIEEQL